MALTVFFLTCAYPSNLAATFSPVCLWHYFVSPFICETLAVYRPVWKAGGQRFALPFSCFCSCTDMYNLWVESDSSPLMSHSKCSRQIICFLVPLQHLHVCFKHLFGAFLNKFFDTLKTMLKGDVGGYFLTGSSPCQSVL